MDDRSDDVGRDPPPPETLHAREAVGGFGRLGRLRSLGAILCGLLILALLFLLIGQTD